MSQHIGPRTISAIGGSVKRVGNYRVHTFPSELVTDGLVLNLDAGDPRSYPSSGTTWTDLSGNGNNGTLIDSPVYSNADGGFIDFVSTSTVRVPISSTLQSGYYTIDLWVKFDSFSTSPIILSNHYQANGTVSGIVISTNTSGVLTYQTRHNNVCCQTYTNNTLSTNTWYNLTFSYDGSKIVVYTNGVAVNTISATGTHQNINDFYLANNSDQIAGGDYTNSNLDGKISIFRYYNRALSAAEVAQNYDALRVRYGAYTNTFTPICGGGEGKVEVLCVAGGGGGGTHENPGGGGGAGGLIYNSAFSVDSNSGVSLSIGQGGTGSVNLASNNGVNGSNSTFSTLTAIGGGRGSTGATSGSNGGSGGGGNFRDYSLGGSGTAGQGNDGGNGGGYVNNTYTTGGGGGAGGKGQDGLYNTYSGGGGAGLSYSISGESKFYAAGGGGAKYVTGDAGVGGSGIGGDGGSSTIRGTNGIPNTGSGGGGGSNAGAGNGSNGVVIVRYPATDYNVEVLVVGGGGGGGQDTGGGGGAGGLIYHSSYPVSSGKKLQVTVGKGGPYATSNSLNATSGSNSIFSNQVAVGGGYGSSNTSLSPGGNGGSGGGGGAYSGYQGVGGTGVSGQGNNGGDAAIGAGGGGGGSRSPGFGGDGTTNGDSASDGGDGLAYSITGSPVIYAAGGGGGQGSSDNRGTGGSSGVGGDGGTGTRNPTDPDVNTGSGGGGGSSTNQPNGVRRGTSGADGIVIIAYKGPQRGIGGTIDTTSRPGYTLHKFTTTGTDFFIP